ncbi:MAG: hypothetical protein ABI690_29705 [Chloroflexota bacterium]
MTRFYVKFLPLFLVTLLLLAFAARAFGTIQFPNPILRGFTDGCEAKPQPCWHGIVPKSTSVVETRQILKDAHYTEFPSPLTTFPFAFKGPEDVEVYFDSTYGSTVDRVDLIIRNTLPIGDVMSILGKPQRLLLANKRGMVAATYGDATNWLYVGFMDTHFNALEPFGETHFGIELFWLEKARPDDAFRWHGFAPLWRYCQFEPAARPC